MLDLFCGTGTLAICFGALFKSVIGVENNPYAVLDARENASRHCLDHIAFEQNDVALFLKEYEKDVDVVVIDPPRCGLSRDSVEAIATKKPHRIIYISCNVYSQKDNIVDFVSHGYRIKQRRLVDQFCHSYHMEHVVIMELV
ncbi:methyltransferase domain-containing protein, partial [Chlamydiia bacterium]|nr:methyltransferase domain-containing protein [Chlamydiia bacterium]